MIDPIVHAQAQTHHGEGLNMAISNIIIDVTTHSGRSPSAGVVQEPAQLWRRRDIAVCVHSTSAMRRRGWLALVASLRMSYYCCICIHASIIIIRHQQLINFTAKN